MVNTAVAAPWFEARFTREMGCTPQELQAWIPGAGRHVPVQWSPHSAVLELEAGARLQLTWTVLPPRRIALLNLPRLALHFDFGDAPAELRRSFMNHFDLYTRRGGG